MCFGASLLSFRGKDLRAALMCFDFRAVNLWEEFTTLPFKSIRRDLKTKVLTVLRVENFYFSESPFVRGGHGGPNIEEGPTLIPQMFNRPR